MYEALLSTNDTMFKSQTSCPDMEKPVIMNLGYNGVVCIL